MKASKVLLCSRNPVSGVSGGQENRLDATNPHTERFLKTLKNHPFVGVWYRLYVTLPRRPFAEESGSYFPISSSTYSILFPIYEWSSSSKNNRND